MSVAKMTKMKGQKGRKVLDEKGHNKYTLEKNKQILKVIKIIVTSMNNNESI
jgi:VCBS repeat-containing protein